MSYRKRGQRVLLRLARSPAGRVLIAIAFRHLSLLLPVDLVRKTPTLLAFHHPQPHYALHLVLVPRRRLSGLNDVGAEDAGFLADLFETVQSLVVEFDLEPVGYRLIANGGAYQDVPHLHFHLISGVRRG